MDEQLHEQDALQSQDVSHDQDASQSRDTIDALNAFTAANPMDFDTAGSPVMMRDLFILHAEGFPLMVFTPAEVEWWLAWNRQAEERHAGAGSESEQAKRKQTRKRRQSGEEQARFEATQRNALEEGI